MWEAAMSRAAVVETGMPSEEVPGAPAATTARALAPAAAAVLRAWDHAEVVEEEVVVAVAVAAGDVDERPGHEMEFIGVWI